MSLTPDQECILALRAKLGAAQAENERLSEERAELVLLAKQARSDHALHLQTCSETKARAELAAARAENEKLLRYLNAVQESAKHYTPSSDA